MFARLPAQQRIHAPAAVEPHVDAALGERVEQLGRILFPHHRAASAAGVLGPRKSAMRANSRSMPAVPGMCPLRGASA